MKRGFQPDDSLARWVVDLRRFLMQPAIDGVGNRATFIAACKAVAQLESFVTAATLSRFCQVCSKTFILTAEERAWFRSRGIRVPRRCSACRGIGEAR
jgi:hypothetical protein